ncbi:hypothetical protein [Aneurinibacillus aneurinilyticus]|jgi:hypothetical protein|uniref:Uncharacterized protein n=1 Tax=Aneurinibacillus aneurinilyticus ATCC 12856 TaxID=649747 RepID=U1X3R4_ANEAE|nr:hypothetical protein [Aneurinibacillus aneurinilyticus]ERI09620.1 hypothetical protein HMPREF0083_02328 [Aneurinibacillus aneurinilyticus ATCC 12856]MCI1695260.1 hypothetical protein [Aneurinibacillus aneurinilyticus]MED0671115.1 hypothetical protein [Aneurinibacillus aneurinilyticus]MED0706988.1 hypothetical protein [Aneurinibacillus aneurinilyticus]MED0725029.1 hypothetical protein [Aneurinibacillus aneurinilyticus]
MARSTIYTLYMLVIIVLTIGVPLTLYYGSNDRTAGFLGAILSFGILASYAFYANLLNRRN